MKTVFVFTGGGLAPALNPTLYGVITAARKKGWRVFGGLFGWASLLKNGRRINLAELNIESLRNAGGTILRSSRTNPLAVPQGIEQIRDTINTLGVDAIVAIGGDDTLRAAARLAQENIPIVGIPKTIDNDLPGTYYTPGFPSAAYELAALTHEIKQDAAYALSRIYIIEAMGFKAGWLTCAGALGGADIVLPPEWKISWRTTLELLAKRYKANGNFAAVVVSQEAHFDEEVRGIPDQQIGEEHGHVRQSFICLALRDKIRTELGIDAKALYPGNYLETGPPIPFDRDWAIALGQHAIKLIEDNRVGEMVCVRRSNTEKLTLNLDTTALQKIIEKKHRPLEQAMFNAANLQPAKDYFEYLAPLLQDFKNPDNSDYHKLTTAVNAGLSPS